MGRGDPYSAELIHVEQTATSPNKTGANTTKTALSTIAIPGYRLQPGAVIVWEAFGQVTLNTANRNFTLSTELGSFATYNTTHSRSGTNHGLVVTTADPTGIQFLANGTTATATDFWGRGSCIVRGSSAGSVTVRGGGHVHFPGLDQGGNPTPSLGFDTDGGNAGTVNTTISNNFGIYVQWGAGTQVLDVVTLHGFWVDILGFNDGQ